MLNIIIINLKKDTITVYERNELNENIISLNELNAIINKLQSDYRITNSYNLVLIMMLNTGCRLNEALALKYSNFSIDDKTLKFNKYLHIKILAIIIQLKNSQKNVKEK